MSQAVFSVPARLWHQITRRCCLIRPNVCSGTDADWLRVNQTSCQSSWWVHREWAAGGKWATKSIEGRSMVTLWLFILVLRKVQKNFCHGYTGIVSVCVQSNGEHMAILRQMWQAEQFTQSCSVSVFHWFVWTAQTTFSHFYCLASSELSLKSHNIFL